MFIILGQFLLFVLFLLGVNAPIFLVNSQGILKA